MKIPSAGELYKMCPCLLSTLTSLPASSEADNDLLPGHRSPGSVPRYYLHIYTRTRYISLPALLHCTFGLTGSMFSAVPILYEHHVISPPLSCSCRVPTGSPVSSPGRCGVAAAEAVPVRGSPAPAWPSTAQPAQEKPGRQEAPRWPAQRTAASW